MGDRSEGVLFLSHGPVFPVAENTNLTTGPVSSGLLTGDALKIKPQSKPVQQSKHDWKSLMLGLSAIILTLCLAEIGLRSFAMANDKVRGATFDPELGWRLVPNVKKKDKQWCDQIPATTNSLGWRDAEHALEKSAGTIRVVALGDSMTFGFGVDYGQRFSEFLEADITPLELINMGVFAYGTDQEVLAYERFGRQFQPDIVLLNVTLGNDLDEIRMKEKYSFPKPYFVLREGKLSLFPPKQTWSVFLRTHSYIWELAFRVMFPKGETRVYAEESNDADTVALFFALLDRLRHKVSEDGAKLLVVLIHPRKASVKGHSRYARIAETLRDNNYNVLDLFQAYSYSGKSGVELYQEDGHWNAAGNRLAAIEIRDYFLAQKWMDR